MHLEPNGQVQESKVKQDIVKKISGKEKLLSIIEFQ
jgi:hypothetical protein